MLTPRCLASVRAGVLSLLILVPSATAVAEEPAATRWIPPNAVISIEVVRPEAILDPVLGEAFAQWVMALPGFEARTREPGYIQMQQIVQILELQLGTSWRTAVRTLLGGGLTLAVHADGSALLIVDSKDGELLRKLHEIVLNWARSEAEKQGDPGRVQSQEYRGVTGWTIGPEEAHAVIGSRLVIANRPSAIRAAIDLRDSQDAPSLATSKEHKEARGAVTGDAAAIATVNLGLVKLNPDVRRSLEEGKNPLAALLFAGVTESLRESDWLALGLRVRGSGLELEAVAEHPAPKDGPAGFVVPPEGEKGALTNISVPGGIAGLSFYRDLHGFYAAKDELFPDRTSGLIFFENMMGIFFSGLDLTEEVFGEMYPEMRFVVAEQEYDPKVGTPVVQFPAFAAVLRMRRPEKFGQVMEEAWQKALGLVNFTRGQQAQPGLVIDRREHDGAKYTVAAFRPPESEETKNIDPRYNVSPAVARVGELLILSSTEGLAKQLIDALRGEKPVPTGAHSLVELRGAPLHAVLAANRESMVQNNMVDKGNSREQAEFEMDALLEIVRRVERASLSLEGDETRARAKLSVELDLTGERTRVLRRSDNTTPGEVRVASGSSSHAR